MSLLPTVRSPHTLLLYYSAPLRGIPFKPALSPWLGAGAASASSLRFLPRGAAQARLDPAPAKSRGAKRLRLCDLSHLAGGGQALNLRALSAQGGTAGRDLNSFAREEISV